MGQKQLTCLSCKRSSYHAVVRSRSWFALYFIPVIPMNRTTTIRCNLCGFQSQINNEQADAWFPQGQTETSGEVNAPNLQPQAAMFQQPMVNASVPPRQTSQQSPQQLMAEGTSHYNAGRYVEAVAAYDQAIRFAPNNPAAYFFKGNALSALRSYEAAITAYDSAIQLSPNVAEAYSAKGKALEQLGRSAEAQKAYEDGRLYGYRG
ncbi:MAG: tetratricopeptide repeat protein [Ktedonobacteraceae bacterium]